MSFRPVFRTLSQSRKAFASIDHQKVFSRRYTSPYSLTGNAYISHLQPTNDRPGILVRLGLPTQIPRQVFPLGQRGKSRTLNLVRFGGQSHVLQHHDAR